MTPTRQPGGQIARERKNTEIAAPGGRPQAAPAGLVASRATEPPLLLCAPHGIRVGGGALFPDFLRAPLAGRASGGGAHILPPSRPSLPPNLPGRGHPAVSRFLLLLLLAVSLLLVPADARQKSDFPQPAAQLRPLKDFKAELLYPVPSDKQGSWVSMCVDPKGRLIVSDQYGGLYRVTPPPVGKLTPTTVEPIPAKVGMAQGLVWAFDSLYVVVNRGRSKKEDYVRGLYRVTSTNNDDRLDKAELLREIGGGGGEHGPHAVLLTPDKKGLVVVCGNQTKLNRPFSRSRVPE